MSPSNYRPHDLHLASQRKGIKMIELYPLIEVAEVNKTGLDNLGAKPVQSIEEIEKALEDFDRCLRLDNTGNALRMASKAAHALLIGLNEMYKNGEVIFIGTKTQI